MVDGVLRRRGSEKWACVAELVLVDHPTVLELVEISDKARAWAVWSLCVGVGACERKRGWERGGSLFEVDVFVVFCETGFHVSNRRCTLSQRSKTRLSARESLLIGHVLPWYVIRIHELRHRATQ